MTICAPVAPAAQDQIDGPVALDITAQHAGASVWKALQLLDAFRGFRRPVGVSALARQAGLPKSTSHRLLSALARGEFVERVGSEYQLSLKAFELGCSVREVRNRGLVGTAFPYLCELFAQTRQTIQLGMLDGPDIVLLEQLHPLKCTTLPHAVGDRIPANCTSLGKAILSVGGRERVEGFLAEPLAARTARSVADPHVFIEHLLRTRRSGVAVEISESTMGVASIAAPIIRQGQVLGAVSISTPSAAFDERALASTIRSVSTQISAALLAA